MAGAAVKRLYALALMWGGLLGLASTAGPVAAPVVPVEWHRADGALVCCQTGPYVLVWTRPGTPVGWWHWETAHV